MQIEELPPNKPNFGLILALFAVTILVIFVIAYFTLDWDGKRLVPHHHSAHPTSELVVPQESLPAPAVEIQGSLRCA